MLHVRPGVLQWQEAGLSEEPWPLGHAVICDSGAPRLRPVSSFSKPHSFFLFFSFLKPHNHRTLWSRGQKYTGISEHTLT